jgi:CHRD domain
VYGCSNRVAFSQYTYFSVLNPAQNVHTTCDFSVASGNSIATLSMDNEFCISLSYAGLSSPELYSHIHGPAPIGSDGDVLYTLSPGTTKRDCFMFNATHVEWLMDGLLYFNIHSNTTGCTAGEIRGQILESYTYSS